MLSLKPLPILLFCLVLHHQPRCEISTVSHCEMRINNHKARVVIPRIYLLYLLRPKNPRASCGMQPTQPTIMLNSVSLENIYV